MNAFRYTGSGDWPWVEVNYTQTNADGSYDLGGLPTGSYRINFCLLYTSPSPRD